MDSRLNRIRLLARINRSQASTRFLLADLSEALGESIDAKAVRPLEESDALWESFRAGYQTATESGSLCYRDFLPPDERASVMRIADCIADQLSEEKAFLLTNIKKVRGAVSLPISTLLRHTALIIHLDGDSLSALSSDRTQGILIDHNQDEPREAYEIAVWGDRWSLLGLACAQARHGHVGPVGHIQ